MLLAQCKTWGEPAPQPEEQETNLSVENQIYSNDDPLSLFFQLEKPRLIQGFTWFSNFKHDSKLHSFSHTPFCQTWIQNTVSYLGMVNISHLWLNIMTIRHDRRIDRHVLAGCSLFLLYPELWDYCSMIRQLSGFRFRIFTYIILGSRWILRGQQKCRDIKLQRSLLDEYWLQLVKHSTLKCLAHKVEWIPDSARWVTSSHWDEKDTRKKGNWVRGTELINATPGCDKVPLLSHLELQKNAAEGIAQERVIVLVDKKC